MPRNIESETFAAAHAWYSNLQGSALKMEAVGAIRIFLRSIVKRGLKYENYYGDRDSKGFISVKVRKFEDTGCTCNKPRSGRPTVSEDVVMEVHHTVTAGHTETARGIARVLDIPNLTVRKLLRSVLHMFPYRFKRVQMLEPGDPQQRLDFANEFCYDMRRITTGNFAYYGRTRPTFVLGPFFFEETTPTGPATCSVTGSRYAAMLKNYVLPELRRWNELNDIVWMQDGVPPHIARSVKRLLDQHFGDRIIPRYYPFRGLRDPQI
ncbi:transposable element tc3 transposase [Trichonephila clavipes]|nr:transposable element tc3 transposase [Trichonephila clavipes]